MLKGYLYIVLTSLFITACSVNNTDLPPVEERVSQAIEGLRNELIAPANGWRLEYQPTPESGTFLILMTFTNDGNVRIQSDVPANNGEFYDQTITYRIDNALGLELILETYAVFHYFFELEDATFGGEFEFLFNSKIEESLIFQSLSDNISIPTLLTFIPAGASDANEFSRELALNLDQFAPTNPQIRIASNTNILPTQQLILGDRNISVFWNIDLVRRNLTFEFAGVGSTRAEILSGNKITLNHPSKYTFGDGSILLDDPVSFGLNGQQHTIEKILLTNFDLTGPDLCASGTSNTEPRLTGQDPTLGAITLINSVLSNRGNEFNHNLYQVNALFIFDGQANSLQETGSISQKLPGTVTLLMLYGVQLAPPYEAIPPYSIGFFMDNGEIYMREFASNDTQINLIQISLLDQYHYTATPPAGTEQALKEITDEIFAGGEIYAFDEPISGIKIFRIYNPCNKYEFFLIQ